MPDFDTLGKPDYEGYINNFAWFGVPGANCAHFAGILEGKLRVNKAENYLPWMTEPYSMWMGKQLSTWIVCVVSTAKRQPSF